MSSESMITAHDDSIWRLAGEPDPQALYAYLCSIVNDDERFAEVAGSLQWFPPGFNSFLVARENNPDGTTARSLQLNLYHEDCPGNEEPHGHSRDAVATWYAQPGARQRISRYMVLDKGATSLKGPDVEEYAVAANCIIDLKDGRRPVYAPVDLGARLLVKQSVTSVASLGWQLFNSTEVHHVGHEGPGVAISAHYKGPEESPALSDPEGLVQYKRVGMDEVEKIVEARKALTRQTSSAGSDNTRLGPTTMMYAPAESGISVEASPTATPPEVAANLILGALKTAEKLVRVAA
jgi:hypothetical protein